MIQLDGGLWTLDFVEVPNCKALIIWVLFISALSHFTLLALTLDRYIFIKKPLHYPLIVTKARTWIMMFTALSFAICVSVLGAFTFKVNKQAGLSRATLDITYRLFLCDFKDRWSGGWLAG